MLLQLDPESEQPLYQQIATAVHRAVGEGEVSAGDRLPAARDLALSLDVNMHTVLRAYSDLKEEGLIELRRGRGAIVREGHTAAAGVHHLVAELVAEAKRHGLSAKEISAMVRKEYS